ncbi:MAG: glycosyltransferase family A protein, partial [Leptospirillia bacterium]
MEEGREQGKDPAISVVIPCFRAGELLSEAIESVLAQTETDWELILVDNNASEETRAVIRRYVERYPEKVRSVLEPEQGLSSARNRGILEAFGKYIALLDDDDMMYPKRLALQKEVLEKDSDAALCYGKIDRVTYDNTAVVETGPWDSDFPFFRKSGRLLSTRGVCLNFPEPRP